MPDDIRPCRQSEQPFENILKSNRFADEQTRALSARVVAQATVIEFLLGLILIDKSPAAAAIFTAHLRELSHEPPDLSVHSDFSPKFIAEISVQLNVEILNLLRRLDLSSDPR